MAHEQLDNYHRDKDAFVVRYGEDAFKAQTKEKKQKPTSKSTNQDQLLDERHVQMKNHDLHVDKEVGSTRSKETVPNTRDAIESMQAGNNEAYNSNSKPLNIADFEPTPFRKSGLQQDMVPNHSAGTRYTLDHDCQAFLSRVFDDHDLSSLINSSVTMLPNSSETSPTALSHISSKSPSSKDNSSLSKELT